MGTWPPASQALGMSLPPAGAAPNMGGVCHSPPPLQTAASMQLDDEDGRGAPLPLQGGWDGRSLSPMPPLCFTPPPATLGPNTNQLPAW